MKYFVFSIKTVITGLIIIFFLLLNTRYQILNTGLAYAQTADLGIYPPVFQIQAAAPSDVKIPFFVQNFTNSSIPLNIALKAFTQNAKEDGSIEFTDNPDFADPFLPERIQVLDNDASIGSLTLNPQQKKDLTLEVQIPGNEAHGDYYLSLIFSQATSEQNISNAAQATIGISSNILLSIGPQGKTQGYIADFSAPFLVGKGPIPFTVSIKNTSNHYITPKGYITIKNMFGQTIGKVNLLPVNILANTIRRIPDTVQSEPNSADYQKIKDEIAANSFPVAVWPEKFLVGPYTATLTLALSDNGPVFRRDATFFAFPLEYLLAILIIVGLVIFIAIRIERSRKRL